MGGPAGRPFPKLKQPPGRDPSPIWPGEGVSSCSLAGLDELARTYHHGVPIPETVQPYYSFADPAEVPLYAGPLIYPPRRGSAAEQGDGTVSLRLAPAPRILMRGTDKRPVNAVNDLLEGMEPP